MIHSERPRSLLSTFAALIFSALAVPAVTPAPATAQSAPFPADSAALAPNPALSGMATLRDEWSRMAEISGVVPLSSRVLRRPSSDWAAGRAGGRAEDGRVWAEGDAELAILPLTLDARFLSGYPDDRNNGLLWAGQGFSTLARAGVAARWGPLSAGFAPEVAFHQNGEFETVPVSSSGLSEWAYPFKGGIDYPQRFGDESFMATAPGQSWIRADFRGAAVGVSTENLWWGPAQRYPLLMSNTAPGFLHAFAGTGRPVDVWIGDLEAELVWARLTESEHFDARSDNDHPILAALVGALSPRGLPGLTLGAVRVYSYAGTDAAWPGDPDVLTELVGGSGVNREGNELFSVFGRWAFPESGAEIYAEWGRDDRWYDTEELIQEPDHSQAYMIGFQKVTGLGGGSALRVHGEVVALQEKGELTRTGSRPLPVWYTHSRVRQGYTHRGQLLAGGGIGVGADAQFLGADLLRSWGLAGAFVERVRRNDAAPAAVEARRNWPYEHDTETTFGIRSLYAPGPGLSVSGQLSFTTRYNRDFGLDDDNFGLAVHAAWIPAFAGGR